MITGGVEKCQSLQRGACCQRHETRWDDSSPRLLAGSWILPCYGGWRRGFWLTFQVRRHGGWWSSTGCPLWATAGEWSWERIWTTACWARWERGSGDFRGGNRKRVMSWQKRSRGLGQHLCTQWWRGTAAQFEAMAEGRPPRRGAEHSTGTYLAVEITLPCLRNGACSDPLRWANFSALNTGRLPASALFYHSSHQAGSTSNSSG